MRLLKRPLFWIVLIAVVLAVVIALRIAGKKRAEAQQSAATVAAGPATLELLPNDVTLATTRGLRRTLAISGSLRAVNQASVKSKVLGEVVEVLVREGETVKAGQILARIDPTEFQLRVKQAQENVAAAQGQLDIAVKNRDNNKSLADQGFISATAYQNTQSQFDTALATVAANKAALDLARKSLADTVARSPIDGVVAARVVQPGEKVPIDARLIDVVDLRVLELEANVPAADIANVRVGQDLTLRPEGYDHDLAGKVVRINPSNQTGSRSYLAYARVANDDGRLRAGLFVQAQLTLEQKDAVIAIPKSAVRVSGTRALVYAIEADHLVERAVTTGIVSDEDGGLVEVTGGLASGARIVRINLGTLPAGAPVRIGAMAASTSVPTPTPTPTATP